MSTLYDYVYLPVKILRYLGHFIYPIKYDDKPVVVWLKLTTAIIVAISIFLADVSLHELQCLYFGLKDNVLHKVGNIFVVCIDFHFCLLYIASYTGHGVSTY